MAHFSRLTGRAGQSALKTATPSGLGYDGGALFRRRAHQGCKDSARINMLVDNMFGDKTLSIIQTYFIIRAVKDRKKAKITKTTANVMIAIATAFY
jgi:hypothetical protein